MDHCWRPTAESEYNVDVTRVLVIWLHACGVSVEGELGCLEFFRIRHHLRQSLAFRLKSILSMDQMLADPEQP